MKQPNSLLKFAAVASSVFLVTGFIFYRAGGFKSLLQTSAIVEPIVAEPQGAPPSADSSYEAASSNDAKIEPGFMAGSKSIILRPGPSEKPSTPPPSFQPITPSK